MSLDEKLGLGDYGTLDYKLFAVLTLIWVSFTSWREQNKKNALGGCQRHLSLVSYLQRTIPIRCRDFDAILNCTKNGPRSVRWRDAGPNPAWDPTVPGAEEPLEPEDRGGRGHYHGP